MVEGLFRFAVPPKFYVAATLPPPPPYERRCKKLPWAEHSLSVAIVVERTLMKVGPGGGAKGPRAPNFSSLSTSSSRLQLPMTGFLHLRVVVGDL